MADYGRVPVRVQTKLLATIGVLYLVALLGVGVYAYRSARHIPALAERSAPCERYATPFAGSSFWNGQRMPTLSVEARTSRWNRFTEDEQREFGVAFNLRCIQQGRVLSEARPSRTLYERDTATTALIASTLLAAVAVGAVLIWTRPGAVEATPGGQTSSPSPSRSQPVKDAAASPSTPTDDSLDNPTAENPNPKAEVARVAESLRHLKALHDEGILTDDEFDTKRRGLVHESEWSDHTRPDPRVRQPPDLRTSPPAPIEPESTSGKIIQNDPALKRFLSTTAGLATAWVLFGIAFLFWWTASTQTYESGGQQYEYSPILQDGSLLISILLLIGVIVLTKRRRS